jgi:hypothetical protein
MRIPSALLAAVTLATAAHAQCIDPTGSTIGLLPSTAFWPADDEGLSLPTPLGFAFPIGAGTFTHAVVESNGVVYLTNGGPAIGNTFYGFADMSGLPGDSPRIAAMWTDLQGIAPGYDVRVDASVPGEWKVTWVNVSEYGTVAANPFTIQAILYSSGLVDISIGHTLASGLVWYNGTSGISEGNGVVASSSDLNTGPTSTVPALYEDFLWATPIDLANTTTTFLPAGPGYTALTSCVGPTPASHTPYGQGCYKETASFYEFFDFGTIDLSGQGMSLVPTGGYQALPPLTTYVPPVGATTLTLGDDTETTVTLSAPFPYPGGSTTTLYVCSNGFVSTGSNGVQYWPEVPTFLDDTHASWRVWHDFNPGAPGSGQVKFQEIGGVAYITWDGVYSYGTSTPETFQLQFDTNTGMVHFHWVSLSGAGNEYLVGYSPGGTSLDPGSIDLSTAVPFLVAAADLAPLTLTATPPAISTPVSGTVVSYDVSNMPPFAPGVYVGVVVLSNGQILPPGLDLGLLLGAPGCAAFVPSLDVMLAVVGGTPNLSATFPYPAGIPVGTMFYAQAAALFPPGSLPNGQNPGGISTSNGITTLISVL